MNKALVFSIVSVIGVVVFSMATALILAPGMSGETPAQLDQLIVPGVLILIGLIFAVSFMVNFRAYRDGR